MSDSGDNFDDIDEYDKQDAQKSKGIHKMGQIIQHKSNSMIPKQDLL